MAKWHKRTYGIRVVHARDGNLHLAQKERTYCGKVALPVDSVPVSDLYGGKKPSGHSYGEELIRSATCQKCKSSAQRDIDNFMAWYTKKERREFYYGIFKPFKSPRPFPKRSSIGGINKQMANVRERCRRKSQEAVLFSRLWIVRRTNSDSEQSTVENWDSKYHAAFMFGVNHAIKEIFDEFKLEKYDKFKDKAYADLHEIITGETLPDERNEEV